MQRSVGVSRFVVAVPAISDQGLEANRSSHFVDAEFFAVAEVVGGGLLAVRSLRVPVAPQDGSEIADVLLQAGVTDILIDDAGDDVRARLGAGGVRLWRDGSSATVREALESFLTGSLDPFGEDDAHLGHRPLN